MSKHNETGRSGERLAEEYLASKGFLVLHRNWRVAHKEIDLIALDEEELVFVEIKTRNGTAFGIPEESVGVSKQQHLRTGAEIFLELNPQYTKARFDVLSIVLRNGAIDDIRHFRDAF